MMSLFDNETILSAYEAEIMEKGREEGREEGMEEGKKQILMSMYNSGMPIEKIAQITEVPEVIVREWLCEPVVRS